MTPLNLVIYGIANGVIYSAVALALGYVARYHLGLCRQEIRTSAVPPFLRCWWP